MKQFLRNFVIHFILFVSQNLHHYDFFFFLKFRENLRDLEKLRGKRCINSRKISENKCKF